MQRQYKMYELCRNLNEAYGESLFLATSCAFIEITFISFFVIQLSGSGADTLDSFFFIYVGLINILPIGIMLLTFQEVQNEVRIGSINPKDHIAHLVPDYNITYSLNFQSQKTWVFVNDLKMALALPNEDIVSIYISDVSCMIY